MRRLFLAIFILGPVLLNAQKKQGQELIDSLVQELNSSKFLDRDDTDKVNIFIELTSTFYKINPQRGIEYGRKGILLAEALNWKPGIAKLNTYIGANYYIKSDYLRALDYWQKALKINEELGNKKDRAVNLLNIGRIHLGQSQFSEALDYYLKALKINEDLKDKVNLPINLGEIGSAYLALNNFPKALEYYNRALAINKDVADKAGISQNTGNIGMVYFTQSNYPMALDFFFKSLRVATELGDKSTIAVDLGNIGESYLNIFRDTTKNYSGTLKRFEFHDDLAALIPKDKKAILQEAIDYLDSSVAVSKEIGFLNALQEYSKPLSEAEELSGDYKAALKDYRQFSLIKDSVFNIDKNEKITTLESKNESEMKEKQLEFQRIKISTDKKERIYLIVFLCLFALLSVVLYSRFRNARRMKKILEEKNKLIAEEIEYAEMMRARAENSEKYKQQFLANMSHEIRTPMNAVNGMTEILMDKNPRLDQMDYLRVISKSSDMLLHIINDILDLSKIEAGKLELEHIDFSLAETILHVRETLTLKAEEKGLVLITQIDEKINDILMGDPYRLNQVMINLGGNAIKFTERGTVEIKVNFLKEESGKIVLKFSVTDSGIGIPPDKLNSLFESFKQVSNSDTRRYGGTGLGLSISKQLIELQGGSISVESKLGIGTTFSFILAFPAGSKERMNEMALNDQKVDGSALNGLRILLAEDNEYNRLVVTETLKLKADVMIDEAINGRIAVELMEKKDYDVVLMDVQMPEMNGFEATRYIREKLPFPKNQTPIIALTASLFRSDIDLCYRNGMNAYVSKPFKPYQLIKSIAELAGRKNLHVVHTEKLLPPVLTDIPDQSYSHERTNMDYLYKFCEGDKGRMKKYINVFIAAVPVLSDFIIKALSEKDYTEIALQLHSFKPKWMMMGMRQTTDLSQKIDELCKAAEKDDKIIHYISDLLQQNQEAVKELEHFA